MRKNIKGGLSAALAASMLFLTPVSASAATIIIPVNPDGSQTNETTVIETNAPDGSSSAVVETTAPTETAAPDAATAPAETQQSNIIYAPSQNTETAPQGPGGAGGAAEIVPGDTGNGDGVQLISPSGSSGQGSNVSQGVVPAGYIDQSQLADGDGTCVADDILGMRPFTNTQLVNTEGVLDVYTMKTSVDADQWNTVGDGFIGMRSRLEEGVGNVFYRLHSDAGWSNWALNETTVQTPDNGKVTAFQTRLQGYTGNLYDIWYRAQLSDGTVTGWASNGMTCGTIGTGLYITGIEHRLWKKGVKFPESTANYFYGAQYEGMVYDASGALRYQKADGSAYTGWAYVNNDKYYMQDNVPLTGWQYLDGYKFYFDESGKLVTDLEPVMGNPGDFQIRVNRARNSFTIYTKDGDNGYIIPYKVFLTTLNSKETPLGTYKFYVKYRWKYMHDEGQTGRGIYCQFLNRFYNGYLVHSLIYKDKADSYHFDAGSYNYLGAQSSDGCVRLRADQAQWVYNNCPNGTQITIYDDLWNIGPLDRPAVEQVIPMSQNYDPTDPVITGKG
ncbi:MAG: L,D-transpeptidase family protein [Eubacteriales bacterium]|nr:L,D-transpeptidase family protein [Eubacteriales bacterium]